MIDIVNCSYFSVKLQLPTMDNLVIVIGKGVINYCYQKQIKWKVIDIETIYYQ